MYINVLVRKDMDVNEDERLIKFDTKTQIKVEELLLLFYI
jgi:hypothetical protein